VQCADVFIPAETTIRQYDFVPANRKKEFRSERASGVAGVLFCNSQLSFLRALTACLAVYHARVSTWAESEVEREGLKLSAEAFALTH